MEIGPGNGEPTRAGSRAQRELVVGQLLPGVENDVAVRSSDGLHLRVQELNTLLGVEVRAANGDVVEYAFARQVCLRQRGALIGSGRLVTDEDDVACPTFLAQTCCQLCPSMACADDDRPLRCHALEVGVRRTIILLMPRTKFD